MPSIHSIEKSDKALRSIREVSDELGLEPYVLRYWEKEFPALKPMQRGNGRRYYRPEDIALLRRIQHLLHEEGYTIKGARTHLKQQPEAEESYAHFHALQQLNTQLTAMRQQIRMALQQHR